MRLLTVTIDLDPVAVSLGPLDIHWYGIAYVVAIAFGLRVIVPYARRRGLSEDLVWSVATWAIPAGLIGGRLYFVVQNDPSDYVSDPMRVFEVWNGGMAFFGAIFAVPLVIAVFALLKRGPLLPMLDVAALFAMVGQPIGRFGNIVNGDVLGPATDLPWGFRYTHPDSFAPDPTVAYHPAAIYEIMANLVLIAALYPLRYRLPAGGLVALYIAGYSIAQLIVFIWRAEPEVALGLQQAQITSLVVLAAEALIIGAYLLKRRRAGTTDRGAQRSSAGDQRSS